jgi:quinol monooxygenase YgiN
VELKFFTPKCGFLWRSEPPKLGLEDQFIWIAKYRSHAGKREDLLAATLTHMNNVHRTEDETLSFLVLESSEDDTSLVLFERYTSQEYFEKVHKISESMQQLRANVCTMSPDFNVQRTVMLILSLQIAPFLAERESEGYIVRRGFIDKREAIV